MSNRDAHTISVIIPTLGRGTIAQTREALSQQTRHADEICEILDGDRRGISWARNEGIRRSSGDLVVFVDDDCIPPPDWLERMVGALDRHQADVAGGTFEEPDPLLGDIRRLEVMPVGEQVDRQGVVGNGGNIMFRRTCLERLRTEDGYIYNEAWTHGSEDWELIIRLRQRGTVQVYVPVPVLHLRRAPLRSHLVHQYRRGVGIAQLFRFVRTSGGAGVPHESLLWKDGSIGSPARFAVAIWKKGLGPFNPGAFTRPRHYVQYWLGEKFRAVGFVRGLLLRK